MQWFRSVHGAPTHRKWLAISRRCGQPVPVVVSVVWALMDYASRSDDRGSVAGFDCEDMDAYLVVDDGTTAAVIAALRDKGWLADGRISSWNEHQTKREDGSAERAKAWRERKRTQANAPNASDTDTDSEKKQTRERANAAASVPTDPAAGFITDLDAIIVETWGPESARPWPDHRDHQTARDWLSSGIERGKAAAIMRRVCKRRRDAGEGAPAVLKYFDNAVRDTTPAAAPPKRSTAQKVEEARAAAEWDAKRDLPDWAAETATG